MIKSNFFIVPAEIWVHQIRHFAPKHHVVALNPRGQGRSDKPTRGYHPQRRALDIGELLEHLGGKPAVVIEWSLAVLRGNPAEPDPRAV